jgi:hypothetical protein
MTILAIAEPAPACPHQHFVADVVVLVVVRSHADPTLLGRVADISITCGACGERFVFEGGDQAPEGTLPDRPSVSVDNLELRVPIKPAGFVLRRVE